jgi:hypothetical protein
VPSSQSEEVNNPAENEAAALVGSKQSGVATALQRWLEQPDDQARCGHFLAQLRRLPPEDDTCFCVDLTLEVPVVVSRDDLSQPPAVSPFLERVSAQVTAKLEAMFEQQPAEADLVGRKWATVEEVMRAQQLVTTLEGARPLFLPHANVHMHLHRPNTLAAIASDMQFWILAMARLGTMACLCLTVFAASAVMRRNRNRRRPRERLFVWNGIFAALSLGTLLVSYGLVLVVCNVLLPGVACPRLGTSLLPFEMVLAWVLTNTVALLVSVALYSSPKYVTLPRDEGSAFRTLEQVTIGAALVFSVLPTYLLLFGTR